MVGHLGVLDEHGAPLVTVAESAPGLRFVAYVHRPGLIGLMGEEAREAARGIARRRGKRISRRRRTAPARPQAA